MSRVQSFPSSQSLSRVHPPGNVVVVVLVVVVVVVVVVVATQELKLASSSSCAGSSRAIASVAESRQSDSHPSPLTVFPSSHSSPLGGQTIPLPHPDMRHPWSPGVG